MSTHIRAFARLGRAGRTLQVPVTLAISHSRNTSWIAWEQPNPALYAPRAPSQKGHEEGEKQTGTLSSQDSAWGSRQAGKTVVAPATAALPAGNQEVSTSGKIVPPTIQTSRTPFGSSSQQTRSLNTLRDENSNGAHQLPTTHLCIAGHAATWPCDQPEVPYQKRVRKLSPSAGAVNARVSGYGSSSAFQERGDTITTATKRPSVLHYLIDEARLELHVSKPVEADAQTPMSTTVANKRQLRQQQSQTDLDGAAADDGDDKNKNMRL
ncbi:hypothetical protein F4775DRAFT_587655 [Biscogniauxia sp. FL1348]|nr:hypothetical protein F4775DRAFT_587655 [Biscogniauxia sp. FL1348]